MADARRTRIAVATAFAAQGLGFAVLLSHVPAFKDRYDIGDKFGFVRATVAYALKRPDLKDKVLQYLKVASQ